jgi:hypothetical protein
MKKNATPVKQKADKKTAIKVIPEIKEEEPADIEGKFKLKQLAWKDGQSAWTLVIEIKNKLDEAFINYNARIAFDPKPYLDRIQAVREEIIAIKEDNTLFPKLQEQKVKEREDEIDGIKEDMAETKERCKTIEFPATAIKMDMTGNDPKITFIIPAAIVQKINEMKFDAGLYKLMLDKVHVEAE